MSIRISGGRLTRRLSLVEHELLTLPEHLSSPPVFSGVRVTRSLVLCVCFVDRYLSFCTFSFGHCVICSSSHTDSDYLFVIFKLFSVVSMDFDYPMLFNRSIQEMVFPGQLKIAHVIALFKKGVNLYVKSSSSFLIVMC